MNPNERIPLILGYLFAALAMLGVIDIFITSASTAGVTLFVLGCVGVVGSTAALVGSEG